MTMSGKSSKALRKRQYKLRDIQDGEVQIAIWDLPDPTRSYDANACAVLQHAREVVLTFGQTFPGSQKVLSAVAIAIPIASMWDLLGGFRPIKERLDRLDFTEEETGAACLDMKSAADWATEKNFVRLSAHIVRASCGDDTAIMDFYQRPLTSPALIAAQPNKKLEVPPVIRISCPSVVLSALLSMTDELIQEPNHEAE